MWKVLTITMVNISIKIIQGWLCSNLILICSLYIIAAVWGLTIYQASLTSYLMSSGIVNVNRQNMQLYGTLKKTTVTLLRFKILYI